MLDIANESGETNAGVAIVKPTNRGDLAEFQAQNCLFTVVLRGKEGGKARQRGRVVRCVQRAVNPYEDYEGFLALAEEPLLRFVVSNTTEAGLALAAAMARQPGPAPPSRASSRSFCMRAGAISAAIWPRAWCCCPPSWWTTTARACAP